MVVTLDLGQEFTQNRCNLNLVFKIIQWAEVYNFSSHRGEEWKMENGFDQRPSSPCDFDCVPPHTLASEGTILHSGPAHHLVKPQSRHITPPTGALTPTKSTISGNKRLSLQPPLWHLYFSTWYMNNVNVGQKNQLHWNTSANCKKRTQRVEVTIPDQHFKGLVV